MFESRIFATGVGVRPAEPCSLTVAATHQLLTQILLHLMYSVLHYESRERPGIGGTSFAICSAEGSSASAPDRSAATARSAASPAVLELARPRGPRPN